MKRASKPYRAKVGKSDAGVKSPARSQTVMTPPGVSSFCQRYLAALNCPRALTVWLLYKHGEHDQLSQLEWNPAHYNDLNDAADSYSASKLLSKFDSLNTTFNRRSVAVEKFMEAERQCADTNRRLMSCAPSDARALDYAYRVREKIHMILGRFDVERALRLSDWGPGVTLLLKGSEKHRANKFRLETDCTNQGYELLSHLSWASSPLWWTCSDPVTRVRGGSLTTVPKNSKTDRCIVVEPGLNLFFQKGIGSLMRSRLKSFGLDLRTQQERNRQLALDGSSVFTERDLATVDFSAASDTIARRLVEIVLPDDWFHACSLARSHEVSVDKKWVHLNKFSSMGNGYTFELESVIFLATALVVMDDHGIQPIVNYNVAVYGDDVLLPRTCYDDFADVSKLLGFTVNLSKSYARGNFRESCGVHAWNGVDITPFYLKKDLKDAQTVYRLANRVLDYASRRNRGLGCDRRFLDCWYHLYGGVPAALRHVVPFHLGDTGFWATDDLTFGASRFCQNLHTAVSHYSYVMKREVVKLETHTGVLVDALASLQETAMLHRLPTVQRLREIERLRKEKPEPARGGYYPVGTRGVKTCRTVIPLWQCRQFGHWV